MKKLWQAIIRIFYRCDQWVEGDYRVKVKRICGIKLKPRRRRIKGTPCPKVESDSPAELQEALWALNSSLADMRKQLTALQKEHASFVKAMSKGVGEVQYLSRARQYELFHDKYKRPTDPAPYFNKHLSLYIIPSVAFGCNLGDFVQSIALGRHMKRHFADIPVEPICRDELSLYQGEPAFCVTQGWFAKGVHFFPNDRIWPVFMALHASTMVRETFLEFMAFNPHYFDNRWIGCRDRQTVHFFRELGLKAYFSRCFTMTLPRREAAETQKKVFITDVPPALVKYIPEELRRDAIYVEQRRVQETEHDREYLRNAEWVRGQEEKTQALLARYREEAALVITGAVHCASPCTAMGIPVVFVLPNEHEARMRADFLAGIIPLYSREQFKAGEVNWSPTAPDIEELKEMMSQNLRLTVEHERCGGGEPTEEMLALRERIADFRILD